MESSPRQPACASDRKQRSFRGLPLVFLLSLAICGCNHVLDSNAHQANALAEDLHRSMAKQDWASIYANADESYRRNVAPEESARMFASIVSKLGTPVSCKQGSTMIDVHTTGKTIKSECETTFSLNAAGEETFFWRKSDGVYRLSGYNVTSNALTAK